jgi:hypothetical protein
VKTEVGALPTPSATLTINPRRVHYDDHSSIPATVVAEQMAETYTAETETRKQEGSTAPANAAEPEPLSALFPGR